MAARNQTRERRIFGLRPSGRAVLGCFRHEQSHSRPLRLLSSDRMGIRLADFLVEGLRAPRRRRRTDRRQGGRPADARPDVQGIPEGRAPAAMEKLAGRSGPPTASCSSPANTIGACSPASRTSPIISSRSGSGVRLPSPAIRPAGSPAPRERRLAWNLDRDGDGGHLEHARGGADRRRRSDDGNRSATVARRWHQAFPRFADDLAWWTEAAQEQRERKKPPY